MDNIARARELADMTLKQLETEGEPLGLKFNKSHNKKVRTERILAAEAKRAIDLIGTDQDTDAGNVRPPSTEFEQAARPPVETVKPEPQKDIPKSKRGGARPGSGRPEGMTNEKAKVFNLPAQPNPAIEGGLCMLFELWAAKVKIKEVALTKEEARDLSLPYTRMLSYMGYDDYIPPWAMEAITLVWVTYSIIKSKRVIIQTKRPELFTKKKKPKETDGSECETKDSVRQDGIGQDSKGKESDTLIIPRAISGHPM